MEPVFCLVLVFAYLFWDQHPMMLGVGVGLLSLW